MLKELHIEKFAIIRELEIQFDNGLMIFTGETGAGKSIILDAIMAVVGGKADATMVRNGADRATIEALFSIPKQYSEEIITLLKREEVYENDNVLTLAREIRSGGRTVARVNGRSVNVSLLKELGVYLVDIHGQSEHLSLLDVRSHLGLLDRYAADGDKLSRYRKEFHRLQEIRSELKNLHDLEAEAARRTELLTFQANEIETAHLKQEEEQELEQERNRLANAESLHNTAQEALLILDEGSPEASAASDLLGQASRLLASLARTDPTQAGLAAQLEDLTTSLDELNRDLRAYLDGIEFNPRRLEQVEERLELIHQLKRKYGGTVEAVMAFSRSAMEQLEKVLTAGERIHELEEQEKTSIEKVIASGVDLSETRKAAALKMSRAVEMELNDLSLTGARFAVSITSSTTAHGLEVEPGKRIAFFETGMDHVEFMIAPNPGEGLKPLVKIASGGETSRLMLALKNVLAQVDYIPTLIFDEIDQGISGKVGFVVGEKLWNLGRKHQVMCVTHLAQLAAFGDRHYHVSKQVTGDRTLTGVQSLKESKRVEELALMTGTLTESSRNAALETLQRAQERQKGIAAERDH